MSAASREGREEILQALQLACSQNPDELKVGEEKLGSWKREKGFYSELAVSLVEKCVMECDSLCVCPRPGRLQRQECGGWGEVDGPHLHQEWSGPVLEAWRSKVSP